ncbi:UNVERIFIED_CONTAM: hypothetical protein GTU68_001643 [Idotea baltica]|nr:hypothetical protein [Idotea baltica]
MGDDEIIVNVQGDEPLIPPEVIEQVATNLHENPGAACATLSERIETSEDFFDPSVVKVVSDQNGQALYFSRAPIPWPRDEMRDLNAQRHIGIYAYRVGLLKKFTNWAAAPLEKLESLEQLRILYQGERIHVASACAEVPAGVDTPEDLEKVRQYWASNV